MHQILWFAIVWIAGSAAILGSLMALGSLLLWGLPAPEPAEKKSQSDARPPTWQPKLKLLGLSVALAIAGFSLLGLIPFPGVG